MEKIESGCRGKLNMPLNMNFRLHKMMKDRGAKARKI